jgi:hypothetical protein
MARLLAIVFGLTVLATILTVADGNPTHGALSASSPVELSRVREWAAQLEQPRVVRYHRVPCAEEKAAIEAKTGAPAPSSVGVATLRTYGPLPQAVVEQYARFLHAAGEERLRDAESMKVTDVTSGREQTAEYLDGLKAQLAAKQLLAGHYWTVEENEMPRLPKGMSFYAARSNERTPEGKLMDIIIPLDLASPELEGTYQSLRTLEAELRHEHAEKFNRLPWTEREAILARADRIRAGQKIEGELPTYFWRLHIDRRTLLASPMPNDI